MAFDFPARSGGERPSPPAGKPHPGPAAPRVRPARGDGGSRTVSAESLAKQQREISVSEFFARNRHLLGFDNKRKALLTCVKEAVDNALDACEESSILPEIHLEVRQLGEDRFRMICRDNGPGIVKQQIPNIFGKLLYGSKFHRLRMARGQQGIGISAAGMYGLITTGKPISIISRTGRDKPAHHYKLAIDTKKNKPDIIEETILEVPWERGTEIEIELVASFTGGRQSVSEYVDQTAIANPHAAIFFRPPDGAMLEFPRSTEKLPPATREIKPHPHGIELGTLMKMLKETSCKQVGAFLQKDFSRVGGGVARAVCEKAGLTPRTWVAGIEPTTAEKLYRALQDARLRAPSTDCLAPMGAEAILSGLLKGVKAEFYTAATRPPAVYRGNPFQIEVGLAYGGELGGAANGEDENGKAEAGEPATARILRFANRVPLLYQQSACCTYKSVAETRWNNYSVSQPRGGLPAAPMVILVHMASVWVPFTSESKEAVADYDEIRKEIKLALAECGRRLATYLKRKKRRAHFSQRRDVFHRYINEVVEACRSITVFNKEDLRQALQNLADKATAHADEEYDEHGKLIRRAEADGAMDNTVVVEPGDEASVVPVALFQDEPVTKPSSAGKSRKKGTLRRRGRS